MNMLGNHVEIAGTYVTNNNTMTLHTINGAAALNISVIDNFDTLAPAFRHIPIGGVTRPIAHPTIIIAPNCNGISCKNQKVKHSL